MNFVELTETVTGTDVFVRADTITVVKPSGTGSLVGTVQGGTIVNLTVVESPADVLVGIIGCPST